MFRPNIVKLAVLGAPRAAIIVEFAITVLKHKIIIVRGLTIV